MSTRFIFTTFLLLSALLLIFFQPAVVKGTSLPKVNDTSITDQAGRIIPTDKPFKRIISLYGAHTENLFALGCSDAVIGVSTNDSFPPEAMTKKTFSYHDDAEKFLAEYPDLVLVRPMIERGYPELINRLEKSGITVVSLQPVSMQDLFLYWQILGALTGHTREASAMEKHFKKGLELYSQMTHGLEKRKHVYFEAIHKRMRTFAPGSMAIFTLERAGGLNVAADAVPRRGTNIADYGKERILAKGPSIDVYLAQKGIMNSVNLDMIRQETGYKVIKAIQNDQVFLVDEHLVSRPSFRLLQGIFTIGSLLYPNVFNAAAATHLQQEIPGLNLQTITHPKEASN